MTCQHRIRVKAIDLHDLFGVPRDKMIRIKSSREYRPSATRRRDAFGDILRHAFGDGAMACYY